MPVFTLAEIAKKISGKLSGDGNISITGTGEIDKANPGEITFLANPKYTSLLSETNASAVIIDGNCKKQPDIAYIETENAYFSFLQVFLMFYKPKEVLPPGIHESAMIDQTAKIGKNAAIGAHVYIGANVTIGDNSQIFPNSVILDDVTIGDNCLLYPLVTIRENCYIGDRAIFHSGVVIGSDGFGFVPFQGHFHKIPQVGAVRIGDDVELGANVTIDRATMGETVVGSGVKLDNLVHLAHNVSVGEHTVMAAQSGVAGSGKVGKHVMVGGQVAIVGHITVGDRVQIAGKSGVSKSVPDDEVVFGHIARPMAKARRIEASLNSLPELLKRVKALEKKVSELENNESK